MTLWAIIPAKDPERAKTRLASQLSPESRKQLSLCLLQNTLRVLNQVETISQRLVISAADAPLALARQNGALALRENALLASTREDPLFGAPDQPGSGSTDHTLNAAIRQAATHAVNHGATALLVLPADLPYVRPESVQRMLETFTAEIGALIVPDHQRSGTNALLVRPPLALPFCFGRNSFSLHQQAAAQYALPAIQHDDPMLALDLDTPEDLKQLLSDATRSDQHSFLARCAEKAGTAFMERTS